MGDTRGLSQSIDSSGTLDSSAIRREAKSKFKLLLI